MVKQVFIVGNKRSGTSVLIHALNAHPNVFISHESDIIWILYQAWTRARKEFECYKYDSCAGMRATLDACNYLIRHRLSKYSNVLKIDHLAELFYDVEYALMTNGSRVQPSIYSKKYNVKFIGDKKPLQQCDPEIRPFIYELFPEAVFLHIVRHPYAVVSSKILYRSHNDPTSVPEFWWESPTSILSRWAKHEQWVQDMYSEIGHERMITTRLEDLANNPTAWLTRIGNFLGLDEPLLADSGSVDLIDKGPNDKYIGFIYDAPPEARRFMEFYGYGAKE